MASQCHRAGSVDAINVVEIFSAQAPRGIVGAGVGSQDAGDTVDELFARHGFSAITASATIKSVKTKLANDTKPPTLARASFVVARASTLCSFEPSRIDSNEIT